MYYTHITESILSKILTYRQYGIKEDTRIVNTTVEATDPAAG